MGAGVLMARSAAHGRRRAHVGLVLLLAIGVGSALASLTAAWRTDHAFTDHLRTAEVGHVVINPGLITDRLVGALRSMPGVDGVASYALMQVAADDRGSRARGDGEGIPTIVLGSIDGDFIDQDRPAVDRGRLPTGTEEVFLSPAAARGLGVDIGDRIPLTYFPVAENGADPNEIIDPIGTARATVVGIGTFSTDVLTDDLYPTPTILLSPDLAAAHFCTPVAPAVGDTRSIAELALQLFPPGCANDARFFSFRLSGGDAGVRGFLATLNARIDEENQRLPAVMQEAHFTNFVLPTVTSEETTRVRRSLEPVVTALRLLGLSILVATVVLAAVTMHRATRDAEPDASVWAQLGVTRGSRMTAAGAPSLAAITVGLAVAAVAGWLTSGLGPVASAAALDPSPTLGIPSGELWTVLPLCLVTLVATLTVSAWTATDTGLRRRLAPRRNRVADLAIRTGDVSLALGVQAAVRSRRRGGAGALLAATTIAIGVVAGSLVYSTNLVGLVSHPSRFGWPYDIGAAIDMGFGGADTAAIASSLDRPEVSKWAVAAFTSIATVNGRSVPAIADVRDLVDIGLPVIDGALPRLDHEVALGESSAKSIGAKIGDSVSVETDYGSRDARVTGIVVLPAIGQFLADRAGLGTGVLLSAPLFAAIVRDGEAAAGVAAGTYADTIGGFVMVDLHAGTDAARLMRSIGAGVVQWDIDRTPPLVQLAPIRPAQIADLASIRRAPLVLAALIALTMALGLVAALSRAIRTRRRELAVLRALGCRGAQIYATLCWQGLTAIVVGLVVGLPIGLVVGSALWRRFARGLGIVPSMSFPVGWIAVVVAASIAVAIAAALAPARRAARVHPAAVLRES